MFEEQTIEGEDLRATEPATFSRRGQRYPTLEARIIANTVLHPFCDCWLWMGKTSKRHGGRVDGRISLRIAGRHVSRRAHRYASLAATSVAERIA